MIPRLLLMVWSHEPVKGCEFRSQQALHTITTSTSTFTLHNHSLLPASSSASLKHLAATSQHLVPNIRHASIALVWWKQTNPSFNTGYQNTKSILYNISSSQRQSLQLLTVASLFPPLPPLRRHVSGQQRPVKRQRCDHRRGASHCLPIPSFCYGEA